MTALPINPDPVALAVHCVEVTGYNPDVADSMMAAFRAGVEAERARAAAETTEEWGIDLRNGSPIRIKPSRDHADTALGYWQGRFPEAVVVRRTAAGPWEVQS